MDILHKNFYKVAAKFKDSIAASYKDHTITYDQLNVRSNQLAHLLREKINSGDIVCVVMERCLEVLIAQLAILKAGGAYLCVDPSSPKLRILNYIEDAKAKVLISSDVFKKEINFQKDFINIFNLDARLSKYNLDIINTSEDAAYIIYTSGSTGIPKAVIVPHRGVVNHVRHYTKEFELSGVDVVGQFANYSFDASVSEIMMAMLNGAHLCIIPQDVIYNYEKFESFLNENNITVLTLPPSYLAHLRAEKVDSLRVLITAGSPTNHKLVKNWVKKTTYVNAYGPSEASIGITTYMCNEKDINQYKTIPIGLPISNSYAYILNSQGKLQLFQHTKAGTVGELYLGGVGIAKGYLNSPVLTAEKFINDPVFNKRKLYKTGDVVVKNHDGLLEFVGRVDDQVKIRGYRVELGEISNLILQYASIKDCHLLAREDKQGELYLCCYLVTEQNLDIGALRKFLLENLPQYMLPSHFIKLEKLPLNSNGKVDKENLPSPLFINANSEVFSKNLTPLQKNLLTLWEEVLGANNICENTSFFALGGDSLKAISLVSLLKKRLNVNIEIKDIFSHDTFKKLCTHIEGKRSTSNKDIFPLKKEEKPGPYPLAPAQMRLYFINQMFPSSLAYNEPLAYIIKGNFGPGDAEKTKKALNKLINSYESLRVGFVLINNIPKQIIYDRINLDLLYQQHPDLNLFEKSNIEAKIKHHIKSFMKPFKLQEPPLIRAMLVALDAQTTLFLMDMHHIIIDGHTIKKFIKEFNNLLASPNVILLEKYNYIDYTEWYLNYLKTKKIKVDENYWLKCFELEYSSLTLPLDYARPIQQSFEGNTIYKKIDFNLFSRIQKVCSDSHVSLYMFLLACFYILLNKYTSQKDIVVGCPVANRPLREFDDIYGIFINVLPIRGFPRQNMSFHAFLEEVKNSVILALEHQDYQLDTLIKKLKIKRDPSRNDLFDVIFTMQEDHDLSLNFGNNLEAQRLNINKGACFADIVVEIEKNQNNLTIKFQYCSKIISENTARKMLAHYENILREVTSLDLKKTVLSQINLFSPSELKIILEEWNNTFLPFKDREKNIPAIFERQAEKLLHQPAIIYKNRSVSYEELNKRANKLAHFLRSKVNVAEGTFVAIIMERSVDTIVAILAILKTGAAYVPIDPTFPIERINFILKDAEAKIVLTNIPRSNSIYGKELKNLVYVNISNNVDEGFPENNLNISILPNQIAYAIYTSGSTGRPKGVIIEHQGVLNTLCGMEHFFPLSKGDKYLFKTNYIFDVSLTEICGWFVGEGTLVILESKQELNPKNLVDIIIQEKITHINFVPSMLAVWLDYLKGQKIKSDLKYIFVAGEAFPLDLAHKTKKIFSTVDIINLYGPTEVSIYATWYRFSEKDNKMLIGKPSPNVQAYILNKNLQPVPLGTVGELFIGGYGLARGYINQPSLTDEKFIDHPFSKGKKLYKTGDLVCYLSDGNIDFKGRSDTQVKLRGFRIELGEIENIIKKFNRVEDAAVILREENTLVAYFVLEQNTKVLDQHFQQELKAFLENQVPYYMVPQQFVCLPKFPLTASGKLDKRALPDPIIKLENTHKITPPENEREKHLLELWKKLLNTEHIGVTTDFFDAGGDSLKVIELYSRLIKEYEIKINDIYEAKNIRNLSNRLFDKKSNIKKVLRKINKNIDYIYSMRSDLTNKKEYKDKIQDKWENISLEKIKKYKGILLTGATGFLGNYILKMLLENSEAHLYLLIRAENIGKAEEKIKNKIKFYHQSALSQYANKITLLCGDLSKPKFGLNENQYDLLMENVDCVLNSAAMVKHYGQYEKFYDANVRSVYNLISFSTQAKKKDLHHMSTVSVVYASSQGKNKVRILSEQKLKIAKKAQLTNHYIYTKALAETLIEDARKKRGLVANIYRIGNVTFCSKTGNFQENLNDNGFIRIISSFVGLKKMPLDERISFDLTYVNCACDAIRLLFNKEALFNSNFNIQNSHPISLYQFSLLFQKKGIIEAINKTEYFDYIASHLNSPNNHSYFSSLLTHLYNPDVWEKRTHILNDKTEFLLEKMSFKWENFNSSCLDNLKNIIARSLYGA